MIKTLLFSTLFPNNEKPNHGVFVENRLHHLLKSKSVKTKVLAPVPWFPFTSPVFGKYAEFARVVCKEKRDEVDVFHPRYFLIPKCGMNSAPEIIYRSALISAELLIKDGYDFDLIDAHYFYPDGVAAVMLAQKLHKPVLITARGSDINLIAKYKIPRRKILWAAKHADALITVCQDLKQSMVGMGIDQRKISILRNGVDLTKFSLPYNRDFLQKEFGIKGKTLLSVGNLIELKGHHLIIEAMKELPGYQLLIIGTGEDRARLESLVRNMGLKDRVKIIGAVDHSKLRDYYCVADALVLASSREGWPNVLLEAMACGCPVIATNVGGSPEIIRSQTAGLLIKDRTSHAIQEGVKEFFSKLPKREDVRAYAEKYSWDSTTRGQIKLFSQVLKEHSS